MSEPDPSLDGRDAMWPGGKVLGGSSSINGMIYLRGQHEDYDEWARLIGNTGAWSYGDVLPYFKRMESNPLGPSEYHGADGPLRVSDVPTPHPLVRTFIEAAQEIGIPFNADVNGATQEGAGPNQGTVRFGRRNSTARAFLRPVMGRSNLRVETEARVDKVLFEDGRARTVVYSRGGEQREATADGEIILSAGAIASPTILLRSGHRAGRGSLRARHPGGGRLARCGQQPAGASCRLGGRLCRYQHLQHRGHGRRLRAPRPRLAVARQGAGGEPDRAGGGFRPHPAGGGGPAGYPDPLRADRLRLRAERDQAPGSSRPLPFR